jgi:hypothetical protein
LREWIPVESGYAPLSDAAIGGVNLLEFGESVPSERVGIGGAVAVVADHLVKSRRHQWIDDDHPLRRESIERKAVGGIVTGWP